MNHAVERRDPVVVGVDDGLLHTRVLDRAVDEARRTDRAVRVVHAHGPATPLGSWFDDAGQRAEGYLRRTAEGVDILRSCAAGNPSDSLVSACGPGSTVVIGDRHRRLGIDAGRTTGRVIIGAPCPVLIIGERRRQTVPWRPVVIAAVDQSANARIVLEYALQAARVLGMPVEAGRVQEEVAYDGNGELRRVELDDDVLRRAQKELDALVAAVHTVAPEVTVDTWVVGPDRPARLLIDRAREADLLVMGHRGERAGTMLGLGSTAATVLAAAPCPVMILGPRIGAGTVASAGVKEAR